MITHIQLTNSMTGQVFDYRIEHSTNIQLYHRVSTLMTQLSEIENIDPQNVSFNMPLAA